MNVAGSHGPRPPLSVHAQLAVHGPEAAPRTALLGSSKVVGSQLEYFLYFSTLHASHPEPNSHQW